MNGVTARALEEPILSIESELNRYVHGRENNLYPIESIVINSVWIQVLHLWKLQKIEVLEPMFEWLGGSRDYNHVIVLNNLTIKSIPNYDHIFRFT